VLINCNTETISCKSGRRRWVWPALLLAALVLGDLPEVHDHDAPGLYNEECPLARLAAPLPGVSAARAIDLPILGSTPHPAPVHPPVAWCGSSLRPFEPRAPPGPMRPGRPVIS
jgi:hypothetical protein